MTAKTIYLKDYQASNFSIQQVYLSFEILSLSEVIVTSELEMVREGQGDLCLDGDDLELQAIALDNKFLAPTDYVLTKDSLIIKHCPTQFKLMIVTRLNPQKNTALSGLYASRNLLCTQCEAQGFRRITYYLDRPDVLSLFTCKMIAKRDDFPILLSNGNLLEQGMLEGNKHYAIWQDPFVKPAYLFALVAGDLACIEEEFITASQKKVKTKIYVESQDSHLCRYAMQAVHDAMRWDQEKFGREYDLDAYMIVAIKDFNMGAMENKGLNIFNSKYVLADDASATDEDIYGIQSVIGHEYFHNWTGNRVTCRDWFQLSLKEGLTIYRDQTFSADMNDPVVARIQDVANLRRVQFPEDRSPLAHPVQPKSYQEINNFYTATVYEKGGEIVRMYEVILGKQGFRKGMDLYFSRHDGQAVTIEDFLAAMADANQVDLSQFKAWYDYPGTPVVTIREEYQGQKLLIHLHQSGRVPLMIPIRFAVYTQSGERLELPDILMLQEKQQTFAFDLVEAPVVVNYLQGFSAPIRLERQLSVDQQLDILAHEQDGFALWDLKQEILIASVQSGQPCPQRFIAICQNWISSGRFSPALLTELLSFPSFDELTVNLTAYDPIWLETQRKQLELEFASQLVAAGLPKLTVSVPESKGQRAWRHLCDHYHSLCSPEEMGPVILQAFREAKLMSDRLAALRILVATVQGDFAAQALAQFYQDWQHQELVMDKWFALQAAFGDLAGVQVLCQHALFAWTNPNKVRALIGSFVQNNPLAFHAKDGKAYVFLAQAVLKLDALNPQVAARLLTPLTRGQDLAEDYQLRIKSQLEFLQEHALSPNVAELVSKSLGLKVY